jgi:hypothetical protein
MLRMYVMNKPSKWEDYLHLVEFDYNNGWAVIFYFGYQDYWTEEGVLDVWGATLPARLPNVKD